MHGAVPGSMHGGRLRGCLLTVVCTAAGCVVGCGNLLPGALLPDAPRRARGSAAELAATIPEHKIGVFVRFCPPEPPFSGFSSTKTAFLCAFAIQNPRFQPFRAQNRGFCAVLPSETLIFRPFKHKIEVFVRFWPQKPSFSGLPSTKMGFLCSGRRRMALESVTAETLTVNVAFLQITEHAYKMQIPHNQIINF